LLLIYNTNPSQPIILTNGTVAVIDNHPPPPPSRHQYSTTLSLFPVPSRSPLLKGK
jgi:hypothetical protein